jgi:hypothetical protein
MAMQTKEQPQFRRVGTLFISDQGGDLAKSKELLASSGLRLLAPLEAASHVKELINELTGKWFWLRDEGKAGHNPAFFIYPGGVRIQALGDSRFYSEITPASGFNAVALSSELAINSSAPVVVGVKAEPPHFLKLKRMLRVIQ